MKHALAIQAAACLSTVAALGTSTFAQSAAHAPQLLRTQTSFDLAVHLPYREAAPLFGPQGERSWAGKHWDPQFLYPQPAHDEQGAVFTIQHGPVTAVWVNTLFDLNERRFQYAYFIPDIMVTTIDLRFTAIDNANTKIHVVYTRTALTPEGNNHVTSFTEKDRSAGHDWQQELDAYLASHDH